MEKFNIEMTKDEMIRYYANKIVELGIKECSRFSNCVDISDYEDVSKFKNEILERIYRDERVADVNLDKDGNFDMVFYTDFCPYYYDEGEFVSENEYNYNKSIKSELLKDFASYYTESYLFNHPYISIRNLINQFAEEQSIIQEDRYAIENIIKKVLNDSNFIQNHIDGIEVYVTPKNYKELETVIEEYLQNLEQEESEELE